jgi:hypothetical protein
LTAVSIDCEGLVVERLNNEIRDDPPIIGMHSGAVSIENTSEANGDFMFSIIIEKQSFRAPLPFVITRAVANWIDIAPIIFCLGMDIGISVHLGSRGLKDFTTEPLRKSEKVEGAKNRCFDRLNGICLIVERRCRTGKIVNFIHFNMQRETDIVTDEFKVAVIQKMEDILSAASEKIIDAKNLMPLLKQFLAEVRAEEACAPDNENSFLFEISHKYSYRKRNAFSFQ